MEDASTSKNTKGKLNASGAFSKDYLVFAITILLLISLLKMSDRELLAPLYEPVSHELGLNDLQFGMIRSSTDVALIIGAILFGLLADRWRRRDIVALGVLCWSAITWGTGRVQNFAQLLLARASMTFFHSAFTTSAYPMIGDMVPRRSRGVVMGLLGATFALGTVIALVVVAFIGTANWRRPFIYFGIPGIILGLIVFFFLREPARGASEDEVLEPGTAYAGRFSWQALKRTLRVRTALLIYLLDACQGSTWWAFSFWAPAYLLRVKVAPHADAAALALLPAIAGFVVGTLLGGWLIDRLRRYTQRSPVWIALISMSGALAMSVVVFSMRELRAVMIAGFFLGLFGYMIMPVINTLLFDVIPPETRSSALAADGVILSAVSALTSLSIGSVSYYVGRMQGLTEGNLQVGFQGAVTVLLIGGVIFSLLLLRTTPADMAALRQYIAQRAVGTKPLPEETYQ
ncbi:MAG: MFS transporter [Anaerolineales bacterium]|nr:MFS transporter [Anaerolineales bacterium]